MSGEQTQRNTRCLIAKVTTAGPTSSHARFAMRDWRSSTPGSQPLDVPVQAAVQEDVDVLGISVLLGAHGTPVRKIADGLSESDTLNDTPLIVGGIIPEDDQPDLYDLGIDATFLFGKLINEIADIVRENRPFADAEPFSQAIYWRLTGDAVSPGQHRAFDRSQQIRRFPPVLYVGSRRRDTR